MKTNQKPNPPYYAVIFTSILNEGDEGYSQMADKMVELAGNQRGFLGVESAREKIGITVSYWQDLESIQKWKENAGHKVARKLGKEKWYKSFSVRVCKVENAYSFDQGLFIK